MKGYLLIFLFVLPRLGWGQTTQEVQVDQSNIEVRTPDAKTMEKFASKKIYKYKRKRIRKVRAKFWDRIFKFLEKLNNVMPKHRGLAKLIRFIILLTVFIYLLIRLSEARFSSLFRKSSNKNILPVTELELEMESDKLNDLIEQEIHRKNYRTAIRYLYIKLLKLLTNHDLINWKKGKTDFNYFMELSGKAIQSDFKKLSLLYEYTWYGNFKPGEKHFFAAYNDFNTIFKEVDSEKK